MNAGSQRSYYNQYPQVDGREPLFANSPIECYLPIASAVLKYTASGSIAVTTEASDHGTRATSMTLNVPTVTINLTRVQNWTLENNDVPGGSWFRLREPSIWNRFPDPHVWTPLRASFQGVASAVTSGSVAWDLDLWLNVRTLFSGRWGPGNPTYELDPATSWYFEVASGFAGNAAPGLPRMIAAWNNPLTSVYSLTTPAALVGTHVIPFSDSGVDPYGFFNDGEYTWSYSGNFEVTFNT